MAQISLEDLPEGIWGDLGICDGVVVVLLGRRESDGHTQATIWALNKSLSKLN